jgi:hypothetical protein
MKKLSPFSVILCVLVLGAPAWAGPPYLTDDPIPVDLHHWEFYIFSAGDRTRSNNSVAGPAVEINNGIAKNTQFHIVIPNSYFSQDGASASGLGDIETGIKYRFIEQTKSRPDVGIFPLAEISTGSPSRGLGNGRTWVKLPVWMQKDWGPWTSYWGGGYAINPAPGQRNFGYGGILVQKTISPALVLGGEVFLQGATAGAVPMTEVPGSRSTTIWNFGGQYNFTPDFSLLFTAGHSFQGAGNAVFYLGLYRTWGPGAP